MTAEREQGAERIIPRRFEGRTVLVTGAGAGFGAAIAARAAQEGADVAVHYRSSRGGAAGKYGVIGLTKSYARAFAPKVRVNAFAPGFIKTEATLRRQDWNQGRREQLIAQTPMGRIPGPDKYAGAALFLASDDAAHLTGNFLIDDGGYSMIGA